MFYQPSCSARSSRSFRRAAPALSAASSAPAAASASRISSTSATAARSAVALKPRGGGRCASVSASAASACGRHGQLAWQPSDLVVAGGRPRPWGGLSRAVEAAASFQASQAAL